MAAYVRECAGCDELAVRLYEWNAELAASFMEVIHHVEILLRNRMHDELTKSFPPNPCPWYEQNIFSGTAGPDSIMDAERLIVRRGRSVTPGRVVGSMSFGFWNALFGHGYEPLWRASLNRCFKPHGPSKRKDVSTVTERMRLFRNRVAHHERLFHQDLRSRHDELLKLAMWIDPDARDWIAGRSSVLLILQNRPH
jgi:hypothetical protein